MRVTLSFAVLVFYCSTQLIHGAKQPLGAHIRVEKFEQCPDKLDMPNVFVQTRAAQTGMNDVSIEGLIMVRREIVEPATLKVMLYKCASKEAPDTCEYYYTYTNNDFCRMVGMEHMPWSGFWFQTTLPRSCPIKVGNYSMNGAKLSMGEFPNVPFLQGFWKVRSTGKSAGKSWHCAVSEFSFNAEAKRHRKRGKQQS